MVEPDDMTREWENRAFTARQKVVIRALADVMFDHGQTQGMAERLAWTVDEADKLIGAAGVVTQLVLKLLLLALQFLPVFLGFGLTRMSSLARRERLAFLERVETSRVPMVGTCFFGWKTVLTATYFEHSDALRETGYDGACLVGDASLVRRSQRDAERIASVREPRAFEQGAE